MPRIKVFSHKYRLTALATAFRPLINMIFKYADFLFFSLESNFKIIVTHMFQMWWMVMP